MVSLASASNKPQDSWRQRHRPVMVALQRTAATAGVLALIFAHNRVVVTLVLLAGVFWIAALLGDAPALVPGASDDPAAREGSPAAAVVPVLENADPAPPSPPRAPTDVRP